MSELPAYEAAWFDSVALVWMVGCGGLDDDGHPRFTRAATPAEAIELEEAAEQLHQEYLQLGS